MDRGILYRLDEFFSASALANGTGIWSVPAGGEKPVRLGGNLAAEDSLSRDGVLVYTDFLAWPHSVDEKESGALSGSHRQRR